MSPDVIDAMVAAGASAEVLAAAWKAEIATQAIETEERRSKDRERQRRHRESRDVAVTDCDPSPFEVSPQTPLPKSPNQCSPLSPPKKRVKKAVSVQVPEWMPAELWVSFVAMRERMERESRGKVIWSEDAANGVIRRISKFRDEGHCPAKLLEKAIVSSWRSIFPDDDTKADPGKREFSPAEEIASLRMMIPHYENAGNADHVSRARARIAELEHPPDPRMAAKVTSIIPNLGQRRRA